MSSIKSQESFTSYYKMIQNIYKTINFQSSTVTSLMQKAFLIMLKKYLIEYVIFKQSHFVDQKEQQRSPHYFMKDLIISFLQNQQLMKKISYFFNIITPQQQQNILLQEIFNKQANYQNVINKIKEFLISLKEHMNNQKIIEIIKLQTIQKAMKFFDLLENEHIYKNKVTFFKGFCYHIMQNEKQALVYYMKYAEYHSTDTKIYFLISDCFQRINLYQKSIQTMKKYLHLSPNISKQSLLVAHMQLGQNHARLGQFQQSIEHYQLSISINPNYITAYTNLAHILIEIRQKNKAIQCIQKAAKISSQDYRIYQAQTWIHIQQQRYELAIQCARKSLSIEPKNYLMCFQAAKCYYTLKRYDQALQFFAKSNQICKKKASLFGIGFCYLRKLQVEKSIDVIEQAIQTGIQEFKSCSNISEMSTIVYMINMKMKIITYASLLKKLTTLQINIKVDQIDTFLPYKQKKNQKCKGSSFSQHFFKQNQYDIPRKNQKNYQQLHQIIKAYKFNPLLLNIIYQDYQFVKNPYFELILVQEKCFDQKLALQAINEYKTAVLKWHRLKDIIVLSMIYKGLHNLQLSQQYFYQLILYPHKREHKTNQIFTNIQRLYNNDLKQFSIKQQSVILSFIFWHSLKISQKQSLLIYAFITSQFQDSLIQNKLREDILTNYRSKILNVKVFSEKITQMEHLVVRQIDLKQIFQYKQICLSKIKSDKKIKFIYLQGTQSTLKSQQFNQFFSKTQIRIITFINQKNKNIQKNNPLFFDYFIKSITIKVQLNNSYMLNQIIQYIHIIENNLKTEILDILKNNPHIGKASLNYLTLKVQQKFISFWKQSYIYLQFAKFILNQYSQLLITCFSFKLRQFINLLQKLIQTKKLKQFGNEFCNLLSFTSEQPQLQLQNHNIEKSILVQQNNQISQQKPNQIKSKFNLIIQKENNFSNTQRNQDQISYSISKFSQLQQLQENKQLSKQKDSISILQQVYNQTLNNIIIHKTSSDLPFRHRNCNKFDTFTRLLIQNNFSILKIICNKKNPFIARHKILYDQLRIDRQNVQKYTFEVVRGENSFSEFHQQNKGKDACQLLRKMGKKTIYCWIISAAQMIVQYEKLGIYQADIQIRNTIKLQSTFEAIDFDYAFQIIEDLSVQNIQSAPICQIIKHWLEFQHNLIPEQEYYVDERQVESQEDGNQEIISYVFNGAQNSLFGKVNAIKKRMTPPDERQTYASQIRQCMILLKQHMINSHFQQFNRICNKILLFRQDNNDSLLFKQKEINSIKQSLDKLDLQKNYMKFVERIRIIFLQNHRESNIQEAQHFDSKLTIKTQQIKLNLVQNKDHKINFLLGLNYEKMLKHLSEVSMSYVLTYLSISRINKDQRQIQFSTQCLYNYKILQDQSELIQKGIKSIYSWIICFCSALIQLQKNDIYCTALNFTDIVSYGQTYAFKLKQLSYKLNCHSEDQAEMEYCNFSRQIFVRLFSLRDQGKQKFEDQIRYVCPLITNQFIEMIRNLQKSDISKEKKLRQLWKILQKQMKVHHFNQFKRIVIQLFNCTPKSFRKQNQYELSFLCVLIQVQELKQNFYGNLICEIDKLSRSYQKLVINYGYTRSEL